MVNNGHLCGEPNSANESYLCDEPFHIMIEKQNIMIEKQNENTAILKEFKEESNKKQDIMIEKQNENISTIQNESEKIRKEIGTSIDLGH